MRDLPTGTVTFLFSDIEGSTRLLQQLGDDWQPLLEAHHRILRDAFATAGGIEVSTEGDAFFVVFRTAGAALGAVIAAQRALAAHPWPEGAPIRVRMGLHTGEGTLGGDNYAGLDVHRAARIAAAGHGEQVLLSAATCALVQGTLPAGVETRDLGEHRLKDLERPEELAQLVITGLRADFPPPRTLTARPSNLPVQVTSFIGREREVAAVRELLGGTRLLTLTGPGGTGKTRLGLRAAGELLGDFADGVFFVPLAPISDPALVPSTIAGALRVEEEASRPVSETLRDWLRGRELLLVLDNFEQLVPAASLVGELLSAAPRLKALVTSRAVLHLAGEQEFPVPPLALPDPRHLPALEALSQYDSVALFIQRARAVRPDFAVTNENAPAVAEICARLDGLPLAIELAAARIRILAPQAILARLEHRLTLLTGGARDLPARQQTLRDAIAWSYDLLEPAERRLFDRLSVFVGGWAFESGEAVCDPDRALGIDLLDGLSSLIDKSLLRQEEAAHGEPRFQMLETIREFGLERLEAGGDRGAVLRRHAAHFGALAEEAEPELTGARQAEWLDRLEHEHDNLRAALRWAIDADEAQTGLRIGGAIWRFWHLRSHLREGRDWLERLLALPDAQAETAARGRALGAAGSLAYWQGDHETTRRHYEASLAAYRAAGDRRGTAEALYNLGYAYSVEGDREAARLAHQESLALYREMGDRRGIANALHAVGYVSFLEGDYAASRPRIEEAQALYRAIDDRWLYANTLVLLGMIARQEGRFPQARAAYAEGLAIFRASGDTSGIAIVLDLLAPLAAAEGEYEAAVALKAAALRMREELGGGAPPALLRLETPIEAARAAIGEERVEAALRRGRALGRDEAADYGEAYAASAAATTDGSATSG